VTRKKLGENREKKPAICLPFPIMNGWVWQVFLPCYPRKPSLRNFAGIAGIFRRFEYFGNRVQIIGNSNSMCKMYGTKTGVVEYQKTPQTSTKRKIKT